MHCIRTIHPFICREMEVITGQRYRIWLVIKFHACIHINMHASFMNTLTEAYDMKIAPIVLCYMLCISSPVAFLRIEMQNCILSQVLDGPHHYAIGDHGNLIVAVPHDLHTKSPNNILK